MRRLVALWCLALVAMVAGCSNSGGVSGSTLLEIDVSGSVPGVTSLDVTLTQAGGSSQTQHFDLGGAKLPTGLVAELPATVTGMLTASVTGQDASGGAVATGEAEVTLKIGQLNKVAVVLHAPTNDGGPSTDAVHDGGVDMSNRPDLMTVDASSRDEGGQDRTVLPDSQPAPDAAPDAAPMPDVNGVDAQPDLGGPDVVTPVDMPVLAPITYSCVCVDTGCGNNAIGGDQGMVISGNSAATVVGSYGPARLGANRTGWACRPDGTNICNCVGTSSGGFTCNNSSTTGNGGDTDSGVDTATVIANFGPDRLGSQASGWACRTSAATTPPDLTYSCVCVGFACGNNAIGGDKGMVKTGVSATDVFGQFGPDRIGALSTGWACRPEGRNICSCEGTGTPASCGNGAPTGTLEQVVSGVSTATVISSFGPDRLGSDATGWVCILDAH